MSVRHSVHLWSTRKPPGKFPLEIESSLNNKNLFLQEKYLSEHNYDEPIDVDSTLKLLNFGDDYSKFIDSMSDEFSDLDPATVKPQRTKRKIRHQSTVNIHSEPKLRIPFGNCFRKTFSPLIWSFNFIFKFSYQLILQNYSWKSQETSNA